jgi:hypothetical protein
VESKTKKTIQSPTPPIQEPQKSSFLKFKWLKIGAIVTILLILLVLNFILNGKLKDKSLTNLVPAPTVQPAKIESPTPIPNMVASDWKTFNYNLFSIKAPPDWHRGAEDSSDLAQLINYDDNKTTGVYGDSDHNLKIEINETSSALTVDSLLDNPVKTTIGGQPAIKEGSAIFVKDPKNPIILTITSEHGYFAYQDQVDQILYTFKFTGQTINPMPTIADAPTWKTYKSPIEEYSYQYPYDWQANLTNNYSQTYKNNGYEISLQRIGGDGGAMNRVYAKVEPVQLYGLSLEKV